MRGKIMPHPAETLLKALLINKEIESDTLLATKIQSGTKIILCCNTTGTLSDEIKIQ